MCVHLYNMKWEKCVYVHICTYAHAHIHIYICPYVSQDLKLLVYRKVEENRGM